MDQRGSTSPQRMAERPRVPQRTQAWAREWDGQWRDRDLTAAKIVNERCGRGEIREQDTQTVPPAESSGEDEYLLLGSSAGETWADQEDVFHYC